VELDLPGSILSHRSRVEPADVEAQKTQARSIAQLGIAHDFDALAEARRHESGFEQRALLATMDMIIGPW
jgi:hypothetical protein